LAQSPPSRHRCLLIKMTRARIAARSAEQIKPTDALPAGKVQRKVSNGIAGLAAAGSSRPPRQKIAAIPASASILPRILALGSSCASTVAAQTRIVSAAGIHRKSVRPFKGIFCNDISEFESYMQRLVILWIRRDVGLRAGLLVALRMRPVRSLNDFKRNKATRTRPWGQRIVRVWLQGGV
jgi:hypothetical protein